MKTDTFNTMVDSFGIICADTEAEYPKVTKQIKEFVENCGIAKQCCGLIVEAWQEPMKNGWFFMLDGQKWTASDYAFKE